MTCNLNGIIYEHNSEWKIDSCTQCKCTTGHISCSKIECPILDCEIKRMPTSECCPICTGECRASNGDLRRTGNQWNEDDCTECKCLNGKKSCIAVSCARPKCENPIKKPDICCPVCENPQNVQSINIFFLSAFKFFVQFLILSLFKMT